MASFGHRLRALWKLRLGVALCLAVSLFAAVWSVERISFSPPGMEPRSLEMATAASHIVIDTPTSALLDLRQDTYSLEGLTNRAVLLGNVISSESVRQGIARTAGVPVELLVVEAPLTPKQPRVQAEPGAERTTSDILASNDQFRLSIQASPTVPMLDIYAQAPDARTAERLANGAVDELREYLKNLASTQQTPAKDQIRIVQLGRAHGEVINDGVRWQVSLLAFVITFGVSCATLIFIARVRDGWRDAVRSERALADSSAQT